MPQRRTRNSRGTGRSELQPQLPAQPLRVPRRALLGVEAVGFAEAVAVTKLDRLARSVRDLTNLAAELEALGVTLVVLDSMRVSSKCRLYPNTYPSSISASAPRSP